MIYLTIFCIQIFYSYYLICLDSETYTVSETETQHQEEKLFQQNYLYILFNHYQNDIIYRDHLCNIFIKIVTVNNVNFDYFGVCEITNHVICYFVRRGLIKKTTQS